MHQVIESSENVMEQFEESRYPELLRAKSHTKPRMLFFAAGLPYPVKSGLNARIMSLLKFFSTIGWDIVLVYSEHEMADDEQEHALKKYAADLYRLEYYRPGGFFSKGIHSLLHHIQLILGIQINPLFSKYHFRKMVSECNYEGVFVTYFFVGRWIELVKENTLTFIDTIDVLYERAERKIRIDYIGLKSVVARAMLAVFKRQELKLYEKFDLILAISSHDYSIFKKDYGNSSQLINAPIPIDSDFFSPDTEEEIKKNKVLFVGTGNLANTDAFTFFTTKIFPLVRQEIPDALFSLAGGNPSQRQIDLAEATENVEVLGYQKDLREQYKSAEVVVCPLRIGSGMNFKVIEAAAMGKAIVLTSVAAEGFALKSGVDCIITDNAEDFAEAVVRLLRSSEKRHGMGLKARQFAKQNYNEEILYRELGERIKKRME